MSSYAYVFIGFSLRPDSRHLSAIFEHLRRTGTWSGFSDLFNNAKSVRVYGFLSWTHSGIRRAFRWFYSRAPILIVQSWLTDREFNR